MNRPSASPGLQGSSRSPGVCAYAPNPNPEPRIPIGGPVPILMDSERVSRSLTRIAHEIVERNRGAGELAIVGVRTRGVPIARRIAAILREITGAEVPTGALDITLYRDDLMKTAVGPQPSCVGRRSRSRSTAATSCWSTTCSTRGGRSGRRSTRSSTSAAQHDPAGRARGPRPPRAAHQGRLRGKNVPTSRRETIHVRLAEIDGRDEVTLDQVEGEPA